MIFKTKGIIIQKLEILKRSSPKGTFKTQNLLFQEDGQYKNMFFISCFADIIDTVKAVKINDKVEITFYIHARNSGSDIWYNNIQLTGIRKLRQRKKDDENEDEKVFDTSNDRDLDQEDVEKKKVEVKKEPVEKKKDQINVQTNQEVDTGDELHEEEDNTNWPGAW